MESGGGGRFYNSQRLVGFSAAGLPLYIPQMAPSTAGSGAGGDGLSLLYHATATLKQVTSDRASFRIFVFLCLNLVSSLLAFFFN